MVSRVRQNKASSRQRPQAHLVSGLPCIIRFLFFVLGSVLSSLGTSSYVLFIFPAILGVRLRIPILYMKNWGLGKSVCPRLPLEMSIVTRIWAHIPSQILTPDPASEPSHLNKLLLCEGMTHVPSGRWTKYWESSYCHPVKSGKEHVGCISKIHLEFSQRHRFSRKQYV